MIFSSSRQKIYALRLLPGQDLKQSLITYSKEKKLQAAYILTCVGSLRKSHLRMADKKEGTRFEKKMEIVSLVGTLSEGGAHLHISLSDGNGAMIGGHLLEGCEINTTAEIVLGEALDIQFAREMDSSTGYLELKISKKA